MRVARRWAARSLAINNSELGDYGRRGCQLAAGESCGQGMVGVGVQRLRAVERPRAPAARGRAACAAPRAPYADRSAKRRERRRRAAAGATAPAAAAGPPPAWAPAALAALAALSPPLQAVCCWCMFRTTLSASSMKAALGCTLSCGCKPGVRGGGGSERLKHEGGVGVDLVLCVGGSLCAAVGFRAC